MPELPEVQTVRQVLKESIIGLKIDKIESNYEAMVEEDFQEFRQKLEGKTFNDILRKGKFLIFSLDDIFLISHLRMEGKFFYQKQTEPLNKHIHMVFHLHNGYDLRYQDTRKFGRMVTKTKEELYQTEPLKNLGPDANEEISVSYLTQMLKKRRIPIKEALLNQNIIAGLGNIYVDEVLFMAKINPTRSASSIREKEMTSILTNAKTILDKAIIYKGTTIRSYTSSLGVKGGYQDLLNVHTKSKCPDCGSDIEKIRVGGRGTYFCPNCQK